MKLNQLIYVMKKTSVPCHEDNDRRMRQESPLLSCHGVPLYHHHGHNSWVSHGQRGHLQDKVAKEQ